MQTIKLAIIDRNQLTSKKRKMVPKNHHPSQLTEAANQDSNSISMEDYQIQQTPSHNSKSKMSGIIN